MTHVSGRITRFVLAAVLLLALPPTFADPARADKAGIDVVYNEVRRAAHPDWPLSVDSSVVRERRLALWHRQWAEDDSLAVEAEREDYVLQSAEGAGLIDLDLVKVHPRLRLKREAWALDTSVLMLDVNRNAATYLPLGHDTKDRFYLPALVGTLTPRPLLFQAGVWEEYEILPLVGEAYALSVARLFLLGTGWAFSERAEAWVRVHETRRYYPTRFDLSRTDVLAEFRLRDPLEQQDAAWWREASVEWAQEHYPGTGEAFHTLTLGSVLRFATEAGGHFLSPSLTYSDSYVVYQQVTDRSLLETNVSQADYRLRVAYEGFHKLSDASFLLAWGLTVEESLRQRATHTRIAHLKVEYLF